jgi:hypothetical protein
VAGAKLSRRPHGRKAPITSKGLIEMLDKSLEEEPAPRVDERLSRVVQIIVEQYDGNVNTFVESNRYRIEANWNQTSKGVYEKQKNLSDAKIRRDAYAEWTAGRVVATPAPERD